MYEGGSEGSEGAPHSSFFVSSSSFSFLSPPFRSSSSSAAVSPELDPSSSPLLVASPCGNAPSPPIPPLTPAAASASHHHIFGPGVPLLLEEVDFILQQQHSSIRQTSSSNSKTTTLTSSTLCPSTSCSTSTTSTNTSSRRHQKSASRASESSACTARLSTGDSSSPTDNSNRWISLLPPPLLDAFFSVRVCGYAHAYLESVDCFLLRGTFSPCASLLVDVSWLSPEIVCSARDSVAATAATAATFRRCSWSSDTAHTTEQLLPRFPLLQFIGEVRPVPVRHLNANDRMLLLLPSHKASSSRFGSSTHSSRTCCETPLSELPSSSSSSSSTRRRLCALGRAAESDTSSRCFSRHSSSSGASDVCKGNHYCGTTGRSSSTKKIEGVQTLRWGRRRFQGALDEGLLRPESHQQQGQEQQQQEKQRQAQQRCTCTGSAEIADTSRLAVEEADDHEQIAGRGRPARERQTENNRELEEDADEIKDVDDDSKFRKSERVGHETEACRSLHRDRISIEKVRESQADGVEGEREVVGLLRARVCRQVNGLDTLRYVHALRLFRLLQRQPQPQPAQQQQRLLLWPQQHGLRRQEQQHEQQQELLHEQQQEQLHEQQEYESQLLLTEDRGQRKKGRLAEELQSLSQEVRSCRQLQQEIQEPEGEQVWPRQHGSMKQELLKEQASPAQQLPEFQRQAEEKQQEAAALGGMRKQEEKETDLGSKEEVDALEDSDIEATQRLVSS